MKLSQMKNFEIQEMLLKIIKKLKARHKKLLVNKLCQLLNKYNIYIYIYIICIFKGISYAKG